MQNIGRNKFSHTGDSPKWVKSKRRREKREEKKRGEAMLITMAKLRMGHASRLGQFFYKTSTICAEGCEGVKYCVNFVLHP